MNDEQKHDMIKQFITANPKKKILIFTETKADAKTFGALTYGNFSPLHGDLD